MRIPRADRVVNVSRGLRIAKQSEAKRSFAVHAESGTWLCDIEAANGREAVLLARSKGKRLAFKAFCLDIHQG